MSAACVSRSDRKSIAAPWDALVTDSDAKVSDAIVLVTNRNCKISEQIALVTHRHHKMSEQIAPARPPDAESSVRMALVIASWRTQGLRRLLEPLAEYDLQTGG
jgi:hypothetical protein